MNGFSAVALATLVLALQVFAEGPGEPQGDLESVQGQQMRPPSGDSIDVDVDINTEKEMAPRWIFLIAFALVFYGTGAAFIESFVNYPSWHLIGADEFIAYHRFISPRVLAFLVAPLLLGTVFSILMLWSRPAAIPAWAVWTAIAAQAVVWASTVTIQVPVQLQLGDHGLSADLLNRLIETNFWLRRIPYAICAGLFLWMAAQVTDASDKRRAA
jgi:hypothetical protein